MLAGAFNIINQVISGAVDDKAPGFASVQDFFYLLANTMLTIAFGLSIVAMALGFVQMATGIGDPKNMERAQRALLWGGIGFVISLIAWVLKAVLINAAGIGGLD